MRATIAGLLLGLACVAPAMAMERYTAVSRTAMGVTGDIRLDDSEIVFQNGRKLAFADLVADSFVVEGKKVGASVYRLKAPEDPVLLNGNRLCGQGRVTYLAAWGTPDMVIGVFTSREPPRSAGEACATYTYEPR